MRRGLLFFDGQVPGAVIEISGRHAQPREPPMGGAGPAPPIGSPLLREELQRYLYIFSRSFPASFLPNSTFSSFSYDLGSQSTRTTSCP